MRKIALNLSEKKFKKYANIFNNLKKKKWKMYVIRIIKI